MTDHMCVRLGHLGGHMEEGGRSHSLTIYAHDSRWRVTELSIPFQ